MVVRPIEEADIAAATGLLAQLGYPMSAPEVTRRLAIVRAAYGHRVWVADDGGEVVGLLHAFFRPALEKPPEVVVEALVVDAPRRSRGIGDRLCTLSRSGHARAAAQRCRFIPVYNAPIPIASTNGSATPRAARRI
jgi:GNAT superfamily N-acetyltransferase